MPELNLRNALKLAAECYELGDALEEAASAQAAGNRPKTLAAAIKVIRQHTTPQGQTGCVGYPLIDAGEPTVAEAPLDRLHPRDCPGLDLAALAADEGEAN